MGIARDDEVLVKAEHCPCLPGPFIDVRQEPDTPEVAFPPIPLVGVGLEYWRGEDVAVMPFDIQVRRPRDCRCLGPPEAWLLCPGATISRCVCATCHDERFSWCSSSGSPPGKSRDVKLRPVLHTLPGLSVAPETLLYANAGPRRVVGEVATLAGSQKERAPLASTRSSASIASDIGSTSLDNR
jgi:hypothetical protein